MSALEASVGSGSIAFQASRHKLIVQRSTTPPCGHPTSHRYAKANSPPNLEWEFGVAA